MIKTFKNDRLVRGSKGKPLGRVILASDYHEGQDIEVALLEIPRTLLVSIRGVVFYIDGNPYKVPEDLHEVRIMKDSLKWIVNSFVLKKVRE